MEFIESLDDGLAAIVGILKFGFEAVSVLCIAFGLIAILRQVLTQHHRLYSPPFFDLRLILGSWLALGLEFQLGADILGTTIAPSFDALGRLGSIAIIRTFLNYFLIKELEAEAAWKQQSEENIHG